MSSVGFVSRVKAALRQQPDAPSGDTAPFDLSEELEEDDMPKFNKLKVVVSGELGGFTDGSQEDDDDSLLDAESVHRCEGCVRKDEQTSRKRVQRKLCSAAVLYLLFMIGELIGGYVANSLAIMTDALHMLTDLVGVVVSLLALWLSARPPSNRFTFGLYRLEVLSAGISVLLIYTLTGVLLNEAVQRTLHQDFDINGDVMLITAAVGVAVNLVMGFLLNQSGHLHSHEQPHPHRAAPTNLAVRAAFIHALGDLVQSVGVLVAAYIIRFKPEYKLADPICTYIFSFLVLFTTIKIIRDTGLILLEGVPQHLSVSQIKDDLVKLDGVHSVEDLKVWSLTSGKTAALVHLQLTLSGGSRWEEVQEKVRHVLLNIYSISQCTVQLCSQRTSSPSTCGVCLREYGGV